MPLREIPDELLTWLETGPLISAYRHFDARPAVYAPFPSALDPRVVEALKGRGVQQLDSHQARGVEVVAKGEHVVVVTSTASGKTLCGHSESHLHGRRRTLRAAGAALSRGRGEGRRRHDAGEAIR
jgi:hypothetical protein